MPTENEETKQGSLETGILFLDNPQLYNLVIQRVAGEVERRLSRRVLIALSIGGVILSIVASVYHNAVVDEAANAAVDNAIGELKEQVEMTSLTLEFTDLINSIHNRKQFDGRAKDTAVRLLERTVKFSAFTERDSFLIQLGKLGGVIS